MIVKKLRCKDILNGEMCDAPDGATLRSMAENGNLSARTETHGNGTRTSFRDPDGNWAGTVVDYKDGNPFLLRPKRVT